MQGYHNLNPISGYNDHRSSPKFATAIVTPFRFTFLQGEISLMLANSFPFSWHRH